MRRTALFALILLSVWCGSAAARTVALVVAEERRNPGSALWKPAGVRAYAIALTDGRYRALPAAIQVRFSGSDTLRFGETRRSRRDPLRDPAPEPPRDSVWSLPCDRVAALFLGYAPAATKPGSLGFGEAIIGYVTIDEIYHPCPAGRVWSVQPGHLEFISAAPLQSRPDTRRVARDSVLTVVLERSNADEGRSALLPIALLVLVVGMIALAVELEDEESIEPFTFR
ncbi:MAG TPA: hypothetical protein VLT84_05310 [Acidobacteriota bacterium]|nr:hypothetical protein [Acidobacteriota bacterium]